jgi:hypothetical protein
VEENTSAKDFYWIGSRGHLISSKTFNGLDHAAT